MDIKSTSLALQNYYNKKDIRVPEEKQIQKENFDDTILGKMSHFKVESPFLEPEPERLSIEEQESLNLLFGEKTSNYQEKYQLKLQSQPVGTFLDVKG